MPEETGASTATDSASTNAQAPQTVFQSPPQAPPAPIGGRDGPASATAETDDDRRAAAVLGAAMAEDGGESGTDDGIDKDLKPDTVEYWKARAQQWERRQRRHGPELKRAQEEARRGAAAAKELEELKRAQMTEQERIQAERDQFKAEATEAKSYNWRLMACVNYGLELDDMDDLHGSTEDEINASAERLARKLNERAAKLAAEQAQANGQQQQSPRNGGYSRPVESLRPGALPASDNKPADPNAWLRAALAKKQ